MMEFPVVVERALTAECGSAVITGEFATLANRAALREIALDVDAPMVRRGRAIYLLGLWADDETVATIDRAIDHLDESARIAAASALGRTGSSAAVSTLQRLALDPAPDVRRVAINGLGSVGTPEAAAVLGQVATDDASDVNRARASELLD